MIYVYAIGESSSLAPSPHEHGLGHARRRVLGHDGVAALFSRHRTLRPEPTPNALSEHEAVVERLTAHGTVLPLRSARAGRRGGAASLPGRAPR